MFCWSLLRFISLSLVSMILVWLVRFPFLLTIGILIQWPFSLSLRAPFRASSSIQFSIGIMPLILFMALPGVEGKAPVIKMFARRCTLLKRVKFLFECKPFIQIIAPYDFMRGTVSQWLCRSTSWFGGESPGRPHCLYALHENSFGLIVLLFYMGVPRQFAI